MLYTLYVILYTLLPALGRYVLVPDLNAEIRKRRIGGESSAPDGSVAPPNAFFGVYDGQPKGHSGLSSVLKPRLDLPFPPAYRRFRGSQRVRLGGMAAGLRLRCACPWERDGLGAGQLGRETTLDR